MMRFLIAAESLPNLSRFVCVDSRRFLSVQAKCTGSRAAFPVISMFRIPMRFYAKGKDLPAFTKINMPALSPTMTSGNIGSWHKKAGDSIQPGDVLVEIETDKAQMDFECQEEGYLAKILLEPGTKDVPVNKAIAILVENESDVAAFADFKLEEEDQGAEESDKKPEKTQTSEASVESKSSSTAAPSSQSDSGAEQGDRIFASPLARKLAGERKLDLAAIKGTGPNGRITKDDVVNFKQSSTSAAAAPAKSAAPASSAKPSGDGVFTDLPLTNMRKVIANRLQESKSTIPHYYLTSEITMDKIQKLRESFNESAGGQFKLSVNDFIIKAAALSMKSVPEVNSAWSDNFIRQYENVDISVAVSTPSGLITPIVKSADMKGLVAISNDVKELAKRGRENKLAPNEYQGGTFTISNLGMFGIKQFTAIINPPQSCILAVGSTEQKMVPDSSKPTGFSIVNTMHVTLSCDHRVVDGAVGAQWLTKFKEYMENPLKLML